MDSDEKDGKSSDERNDTYSKTDKETAKPDKDEAANTKESRGCMTTASFINLLLAGATVLCTLALVISSFLTFGAICVQAFIYNSQLGEMKKSTEAATKAAKAAEDSVTLAAQNSQNDLRAWVTVDQISSEPSGVQPGTFVIKVVFKNTGKTPALKVYAWIKQSERLEDIPKVDPVSENPAMMMLGPGAIGNTSTADNPIPDELAKAIAMGKRWYVSGTIWYEDIFGKRHWTQFAFWVGNDFKFFGPTAVHNGCDDYGEERK